MARFIFGGGNLGVITEIGHSRESNEIDVTGLEDIEHVHRPGVMMREITIEATDGAAKAAEGAIGQGTIIFKDGQQRNCGMLLVASVEETENVEGGPKASYTLRRAKDR